MPMMKDGLHRLERVLKESDFRRHRESGFLPDSLLIELSQGILTGTSWPGSHGQVAHGCDESYRTKKGPADAFKP